MKLSKYRKPDQYYYDNYDRYTIEIVKEIEAVEGKEYPKTIIHEGKEHTLNYNPYIRTKTRGVHRARDRESTVKKYMFEDEEKDRLVERHSVPEHPMCNVCGTRMYLSGHVFDFFDHKFLFVFDCPTENHKSRKMVHPKGDVVTFPVSKCRECGGELTFKTKKSKHILTSIDQCKSCGHKETFTYDLTPEKPINEADRKEYCEKYVNGRTFWEDLEAISNLSKYIKEKEAEKLLKDEAGVDKIERLNIPQIKSLVAKVCEDAGFTEFITEKPELGRNVIMEFSVQDPTNRTENESIKVLTDRIPKALFRTNWRLQASSVSYRLAYLTAKLKAYESDEDLLKLAQDITKKTGDNSK